MLGQGRVAEFDRLADEPELGAFDRRQQGQDGEPGGGVDDRVQGVPGMAHARRPVQAATKNGSAAIVEATVQAGTEVSHCQRVTGPTATR